MYLFRAPAVLHLEINQHLVILFHSPPHRACGLVVAPENIDRKDLVSLLETMWGKLNEEMKTKEGYLKGAYSAPSDPLQVEDKQLTVKVFGCPLSHSPALTTATTWLKHHGLDIQAQDTGRRASRTLNIECGTGKAGVQYAESANPLVFLTGGSARQRLPSDGSPSEMLVLSDNPVHRTLARQAIEEHRNWTAQTPTDIAETLRKTKFKKVPWAAVLVSEHAAPNNRLEPWLTRLQKEQLKVRRFWSGTDLPPFAGPTCQLRHLPPLAAETIDQFKQELAEALSEEIPTATRANVIPFPKRRKL